MFICTELIEQTTKPPRRIFGLSRTSSSLGQKFIPITELRLNCHFFEGVKIHIISHISHPIRDRDMRISWIIPTTNHNPKSFSNYYVIMIAQKLKKFIIRKVLMFFVFRRHEVLI